MSGQPKIDSMAYGLSVSSQRATMNPAFEKRYLASFNSFDRDIRQMTGDPFLSEGAIAIKEFTLAEIKRFKVNDHLQIDGIYFLVLNLYHLVYRPACATSDTKPCIDLVLAAIQSDITFLIDKAVELKHKQGIKLHDVLQLMAKHYDDLRSLQVPFTSTSNENLNYRRN